MSKTLNFLLTSKSQALLHTGKPNVKFSETVWERKCEHAFGIYAEISFRSKHFFPASDVSIFLLYKTITLNMINAKKLMNNLW